MPFDASGNFIRLRGNSSWAGDAAAHTPIKSDLHDQNDNDLAQGLSSCITKTGSTQPIADIPLAGHRLINVGAPTAPGDAATKDYVDNISGFSTSLSLTGADLNGRINFTAGTGAQGLGWTGADMAWLARLGVAAQERNRLVLNDKVDGTGNDVFKIDEGGWITGGRGQASNLVLDPSASQWRTPVAGWGTSLAISNTAVVISGLDAVTSSVWAAVTPRPYFGFNATSGNALLQLFKTTSTSGNHYNGIYGYVQAPGGSASLRWTMYLGDNTNETGSNAGSNFTLYRYSDTGAALGAALTINRQVGSVSIGRPAAGNYCLYAYGAAGAGAVIGYTSDTNYYGILGHYVTGVAAYSFYGNGTAYNSSAWTVSDGRMKSELAACDCRDAHSKVRALPVLSYRKNGTPVPERGWLAQDIEQLIPDAVMDVPIPDHDQETRAIVGGDTVKATNDRTMLATLWAAFQHQAEIIDRLQARLDALEAA